MNASSIKRYWHLGMMVLLLCPWATWGQSLDTQASREDHLQREIEDLHAQIEELKSQLQELRHQELRGGATDIDQDASAFSSSRNQDSQGKTSTTEDPAFNRLKEDLALVNQKVDEEYQTKVESSSRYRVRLSGMFLTNFFANRGVVDNIESPTFPIAPVSGQSNGSFGGTVRQTQIGLEVIGPNLLHARSSGNIEMDFAGGLADSPGGSTIGLPRLRTGTVRLDWTRTSLVAGQDRLFFSPRDPTSLASLEQPAFAYSGNLWGWVPQIRIEHRFSAVGGSQFTLTGGILDPVSLEFPADGNNRDFGVGEASLQPAIATHLEWSKSMFEKTLSLGAGAFRARQNWQTSFIGNQMTSWLLLADWDVPMSRGASLSGSFYRGNSVGAFGGGIGQSVVTSGAIGPAASGVAEGRLSGVDSVGGWVQFKYQPTEKLEFNNAIGQDNPYANELRIGQAQSYANVSLFRDRTIFSNVIYRPRSNLLLSLELRRISTVQLDGSNESANHINMGVGILF